jgi:pyruvate/2-oxoglutarate dehydrogenase complex dihydrolipoamide dehydrogenase (E3) component
MSAVPGTRTIAETRGFIKALVDAQYDRILGFTMLTPEVRDVMAVVQKAMLAGFLQKNSRKIGRVCNFEQLIQEKCTYLLSRSFQFGAVKKAGLEPSLQRLLGQ